MSETEGGALKLEGVLGGLGGKLSGFGDALRSGLSGMIGGAGFAAMNAAMEGIGRAFAGVRSSVIDTNAELEQSTVSWGVLLGSTEQAQAKLADLSKFAAQTPFDFPGVQKASLLLQTFGGDALNTTKTLTLVGDVAAGVNQPFEDVAMWTGRMYSAMKNGQPFGEAAARLQEMGAMSGETRLKLEQMQKSGASSEQLWAAFSDSMGRFGGMMEKQSKTFVGQMSTMQDSLNMLAAQAGKPIFDLLTAGLGKVNALLSSDAVTHGVARFAAGLQSGVGAVGDFGRYLRAVADDGDYLNDWLTHLPARVRPLVQAFGVLTATARQVATILTRRDFVGGGWLDEDSPLVTGLFALLRAFDLGRDAIQTFREAVRGDWFGGQTQSINGFVRTVGRGVQLARDSVLTLREALAGQWTNDGTINGLVVAFGRLGNSLGALTAGARGLWQILTGNSIGDLAAGFARLPASLEPFAFGLLRARDAVRGLWQILTGTTLADLGAGFARLPASVQPFAVILLRVRGALLQMWAAVRPLLPQFLAIGRAIGVVTSPILSFVKALAGAGGDVRGALNSMRTTLTSGLAALGTVLKTLGPPLARALWGFLGDAAGDFGAAWQANDVNGKVRRFLGEQLPKLAGGALDLGKRLWAGLPDMAAAFGQWWTDHNVTQGLQERLARFLGGLGDFGGAIWSGLQDLGGKFAAWWNENKIGDQIKDRLGALLGNLGDYAGQLWSNIKDLPGTFRSWWDDNNIGGQLSAVIGGRFSQLGGLGRRIFDSIPDWSANFVQWWNENGVGDRLTVQATTLLGRLQGLGAAIWSSVKDLSGDFKAWWDANNVGKQIDDAIFLKLQPAADAALGRAGQSAGGAFGKALIGWFKGESAGADGAAAGGAAASNLGQEITMALDFLTPAVYKWAFAFGQGFGREIGKGIVDQLPEWMRDLIGKGTPNTTGIPVSPGFGPALPGGGSSAGNNISNAPPTPRFNALAFGAGGGITVQTVNVTVTSNGTLTIPELGAQVAESFLGALQAATQGGQILPAVGVVS